jgi:hypothetical protein
MERDGYRVTKSTLTTADTFGKFWQDECQAAGPAPHIKHTVIIAQAPELDQLRRKSAAPSAHDPFIGLDVLKYLRGRVRHRSNIARAVRALDLAFCLKPLLNGAGMM